MPEFKVAAYVSDYWRYVYEEEKKKSSSTISSCYKDFSAFAEAAIKRHLESLCPGHWKTLRPQWEEKEAKRQEKVKASVEAHDGGWRKRVIDARHCSPKELTQRQQDIVRRSRQITCPECKGEPPKADCGCGDGYECCDYETWMEPPCDFCGYQNVVLQPPEDATREEILELNEDPCRGMPSEGEDDWPPERFLVPTEEGEVPEEEHPGQQKLPI